MWRFLFYVKLTLGMVARLVLDLFQVPDDYNDVFDDGEEDA